MDKFVQVLKEWQRVNRSAAILDNETVEKIAQSSEMQSFDPSVSQTKSSIGIVGGGFKNMKQQAKSAAISERIERAMVAEKEDVVMVEETTDKVY
jgi:rubrerythrin